MNPYQPPHFGYPQQGHGAPPGYGYGGPPPPYPIQGIVSLATPTIGLLGARAALPVLMRAVGSFIPWSEGLSKGYEALRGLLGMAAIACFLFWFVRLYSWVRATRAPTAFTNTMAVVWWFIPFGNFVMPCIVVQDAWKKAGFPSGAVVAIWWVGYMFATFWTSYLGFAEALHWHPFSPGVGQALGWLFTLSQVIAYGLLAYIVQELTKRAKAG